MNTSMGNTMHTLSVNVKFHDQKEGQKLPTTQAYLFDRTGRLVDAKSIGKEQVTFEINPDQRYQVMVGPHLVTAKEQPPADLMAQLTKAKAITKDYIPELGLASLSFTLFPPIWICWFPTCIPVYGTVRKSLNPGYAPICTGTVQIFQVDLACTLDSFTFYDLITLRDRLVQLLRVPLSGITQNLKANLATTAKISDAATAPANLAFAAASASTSAISLEQVTATLSVLDGTALKQFLVQQNPIFWSFWCELIPDSAFCWQELGEVPLQSDGSFFAEVCFWCPQDFPDLYFEVIQNVDGITREIYDPQIACSTYYNYDGSSPVDIIVEDPNAVACQPNSNPGPTYLYVWPTGIGNEDLGNINGLETGLGTGLLPGSGPGEDRPFGGTLSVQMQFDPNLQANNIQYYRWSYMFDGDAGFTPINATVVHRYMTFTVLPGPVFEIHLNPVTLGPQLVGGNPSLFAIPDPNLDWIDINDPADRPFAYFDSTGGVTPRRSGMCTLMLEMFDSSGNFVPCNNTRGASTLGDQPSDPATPGAFTYILPQIGGPPNTYTNAPTPNITDDGRLIFRIQVDNNATDAELTGVSTPLGSTDTDPCGFLHYNSGSDPVTIDYVAFQLNNFLDWYLSVSRGLSGVVAGIPPSPPPNNTSSGSHGSPAAFINSASALLGTCTQAAFAVNLYCQARATDGYSRQSQYDTSATIAFALTTP